MTSGPDAGLILPVKVIAIMGAGISRPIEKINMVLNSDQEA